MNNRFIDDIKENIYQEFKKFDVEIDKTKNIKYLMIDYINWRQRLLKQVARKVLYSKELKQNINFKQHQKVIEKIEYKIKNGHDITPFLSQSVIKHSYIEMPRGIDKSKDTFLNAFGMHHLHLGKKYDNEIKGLKFVNGGNGELLYIKVDRDTVYFIDIGDHSFFHEELFKIVKNNWSFLLEPCKLKGFLPLGNRSKEENKSLKNHGINTSLEIDGEVYALSTLVSNKHNMNTVRNIRPFLEQLKNIVSQVNGLSDNERENIHIKIKDGKLFFVDEYKNITYFFDIKTNQIHVIDKIDLNFGNTFDFNS